MYVCMYYRVCVCVCVCVCVHARACACVRVWYSCLQFHDQVELSLGMKQFYQLHNVPVLRPDWKGEGKVGGEENEDVMFLLAIIVTTCSFYTHQIKFSSAGRLIRC